jgi:hypothetical protein
MVGGKRSRGPGKRQVAGKDFRLADEVRYIQRRAAAHAGRFVTIGPLALFSTKASDAWLLDRADHLAAAWRGRGIPNRSTWGKPTPRSRLLGRTLTTPLARCLSAQINILAASWLSSDIPPTASNMFN